MPGRAWGRLFLAWATAGFVASAALHLATFTPLPLPRGDGPVLALFAGAFVPLIAMLGRLRRAAAPTVTWRRLRVYDWRALAAPVPEGIRFLAFGAVLYTLMNLVLSLMLGGERAVHLRLLSGHLLLFYLVPLIYFRFIDPRRGPSGSAPDPRGGLP